MNLSSLRQEGGDKDPLEQTHLSNLPLRDPFHRCYRSLHPPQGDVRGPPQMGPRPPQSCYHWLTAISDQTLSVEI